MGAIDLAKSLLTLREEQRCCGSGQPNILRGVSVEVASPKSPALEKELILRLPFKNESVNLRRHGHTGRNR